MTALYALFSILALTLVGWNYGRCTNKSDVRVAWIPTAFVIILALALIHLFALEYKGGS